MNQRQPKRTGCEGGWALSEFRSLQPCLVGTILVKRARKEQNLDKIGHVSGSPTNSEAKSCESKWASGRQKGF
jgi:hypothetical protein